MPPSDVTSLGIAATRPGPKITTLLNTAQDTIAIRTQTGTSPPFAIVIIP